MRKLALGPITRPVSTLPAAATEVAAISFRRRSVVRHLPATGEHNPASGSVEPSTPGLLTPGPSASLIPIANS
ncbi:hypothetical protein ACLOJK_029650 [Asimina triloba]